MSNIDVVIAVTNDILSDQRVQKVYETILEMGFSCQIIGVDRKGDYRDDFKRIKVSNQKGPRFYWEYNQKLARELKSMSPKLIYGCDPDTLLGITKSKAKSQGLIYDSHELYIETPELMNRPLHKYLWRRIEKRGVAMSDECITVSRGVAKELQKAFDRKFHVIRNLPRFEKESQVPTTKENILIYQGVLNVGRGLHESIDALRFLPDYELWLVGKGDIEAELKTYVERTGMIRRVKFLGRIEPDALRSLTAQAKYGLNLIDGVSANYRLSLANKFFDYMNAMIPSINMNFSEYMRILDNYNIGRVISELRGESIAKSVREMDEISFAVSDSFLKDVRTAKKSLNWENESSKLKEIIQRVMLR